MEFLFLYGSVIFKDIVTPLELFTPFSGFEQSREPEE